MTTRRDSESSRTAVAVKEGPQKYSSSRKMKGQQNSRSSTLKGSSTVAVAVRSW
jgi:hypothetical protein